MIDRKIVEKIEELSELVVLSDVSDLQALGKIHTYFEDLNRLAVERAERRLGEITEAAKDLVEKIIMEEVDSADESYNVISRTISALQSLSSRGENIEEIEFPRELECSIKSEKDKKQRGDISPNIEIPENIDEEIFVEFLSQQSSVLQEIEELILALDTTNDKNYLPKLKRVFHTLKGEAGLLGLKGVEEVCHKIEEVIEYFKPGKTTDILLDVKDWLKNTFAYLSGKGDKPEDSKEILKRVSAAGKTKEEEESELTTKGMEHESVQSKGLSEKDATLISDFISEAAEHLESADMNLLKLESNPDDRNALDAVFRAFHTIKGVAGFIGFTEISELAHVTENLLDRVRNEKVSLISDVMDVVFEAVDGMRCLIDRVSEIGYIDEDKNKLSKQLKTKIEQIANNTIRSESVLDDINESEEHMAQNGSEFVPLAESKAMQIKEPIKVDAERLDQLVDTIGELVIAESMVSQSPEIRKAISSKFGRYLNQLDKVTRELQEMGMSLRMIPIRSTFQKMARLVRDLSKKANKPVEFSMVGEDTELDKAVVDKMGDPLIHIIRNAVDHGIESREERLKSGKPEKGKIDIRSYHKGGNIYIEVEDDGRGMDREAILNKAIERGIIQSGSNLSDNEVWNLVFEPGFSTAEKVTEVSGRGVGMDVVKKYVESLRGNIEINSEWGKGTTVIMRLPLTLAIIDGMVVKVGEERYIIPTLSVITSLRPEPEDISTTLERGEMIFLHDKLIPLFRLYEIFNVKNAENDATKALVVVVEYSGRQIGLLVDELIGDQQIVIKSLGSVLKTVSGISGGAIMPDGKVGLIIDVSGVMKIIDRNVIYNN